MQVFGRLIMIFWVILIIHTHDKEEDYTEGTRKGQPRIRCRVKCWVKCWVMPIVNAAWNVGK